MVAIPQKRSGTILRKFVGLTAISLALNCVLFSARAEVGFETTASGKNIVLLRQLNKEAETAYQARHFESAQAKFSEALKLAVGKPGLQIVLLSNLGAAYRENHKYSEAEAAFKEALDIAAKSSILDVESASTAMRQYALLLRKMHRIDEADALDARALANSGARALMPKTKLDDPDSYDSTSKLSDSVSSGPTHSLAPNDRRSGRRIIEVSKVSIADARKWANQRPDDPNMLLLLAQKYQDASDWPNVISTLQTFIQRFHEPGKKMHGPLARAMYKNGQYADAILEMKQAIDCEPDNGDLLLALHDYQDAAGDPRAALETEEKFLEKFPEHSAYAKVAQHVEYAKQDIDKQQNGTQGNSPSANERYKCWPANLMPLKVFIHNRYDDTFKLPESPTASISEDTPDTLIQRACDAWCIASGNLVSFTITDRAEEAQIEVFYTDDPNGLEQGWAQGLTEHNYGDSKARVRLSTVNSSTGKSIDRAEFLDTVLHELGHALGLEHSTKNTDIMYQSLKPQPLCQLSSNDSARIQALYAH